MAKYRKKPGKLQNMEGFGALVWAFEEIEMEHRLQQEYPQTFIRFAWLRVSQRNARIP